ncbi:MAG: leucine--tRNA ligase, partial [Oscillospiraceae bacterium]|nr:leucine--tRNA ligase [Oscillospiraceae bacterium]
LANYDEVAAYRDASARKSDFERTELNKDKTGVALDGIAAINPVTGLTIPVWVSDYVLMSYGTGAIMAVPAHDERDFEFAKKFSLPIVEVVAGGDVDKEAYTDIAQGILVNSGMLNGLSVKEAKETITKGLVEQGLGEKKVNFKLRDWVFSRQRYWGEPIPLVHCEQCGWVPLPEDQLPLLLPDVDKYEPTDSGESPLAAMTDWVNTTCPHCGAPARRETDTMPNWAGSSWYFLRYMDPHNDQALAAPDKLNYWGPVDWYNGGMEHVTLHLLYSRFWHRFLYDIGVVSYPEPYLKRTTHGFVLGEDGVKMSKSRGNVINPDAVVSDIGADATRLYIMFMGAFDQAIPWSTNGALGCRRFLDRVWRLQEVMTDTDTVSQDMRQEVHACIKKVSEDFERMKFNTAIAAMMTLVNSFYNKGSITRGELKLLVQLLNPVAPHITEDIWQRIGGADMLAYHPWPRWNERYLQKDEIEIAIQINGKVRGRMTVSADLTAEAAQETLPQLEAVQALIAGRTVRKVVYVPGRLLNIVVA